MKVTVVKENSEHYGKKGTVYEETEEGLLAVYLPHVENILVFQKNEIQQKESSIKKLRIPRSRKSFYLFVHSNCSKQDIIKMIKMMIKSKKFVIKQSSQPQESSVSEKYLFDFILDNQNGKKDIVQKIRTLKNEGQIDFKLPARDDLAK